MDSYQKDQVVGIFQVLCEFVHYPWPTQAESPLSLSHKLKKIDGDVGLNLHRKLQKMNSSMGCLWLPISQGKSSLFSGCVSLQVPLPPTYNRGSLGLHVVLQASKANQHLLGSSRILKIMGARLSADWWLGKRVPATQMQLTLGPRPQAHFGMCSLRPIFLSLAPLSSLGRTVPAQSIRHDCSRAVSAHTRSVR